MLQPACELPGPVDPDPDAFQIGDHEADNVLQFIDKLSLAAHHILYISESLTAAFLILFQLDLDPKDAGYVFVGFQIICHIQIFSRTGFEPRHLSRDVFGMSLAILIAALFHGYVSRSVP